MQVYILSLCVLSGTLLLIQGRQPGAIEALLPEWVSAAWAVILMVGAAAALFGSYWSGGRAGAANSLTVERAGLSLVGAAAIVYGAAIIAVASIPGVLAGAITLGFGWACLKRAVDIGRIIRKAIRQVKAEEASP